MEALPRQEDLIIAQKKLMKAQAALKEAKLEYCIALRQAKCSQEKCLQFYKYQQTEADFLAAQAYFQKVRCGTWQPDLKIAHDQLEQARVELEALESAIEQTYIKSPIDGTVLQIKIREGETLNPNNTAIIVGNIEKLNLRVSIDQFNIKQFRPEAPAVAFKQGDLTTEFPLQFIHIEPFMVPKKYLTNSVNEKVDTQVFEVLYHIENNSSQLYIGEQMDVYIDVGNK